MNHPPRFQAEYFIQQHVEELRRYVEVFNTRIANAFSDLQAEAERIQEDEYARLAASGYGPYDDDSIV